MASAASLRSKSSAAIAAAAWLRAEARARVRPRRGKSLTRFHLLQNLRETIETQLSRADRSTGRALLPESNDEDQAATIAWFRWSTRDAAARIDT